MGGKEGTTTTTIRLPEALHQQARLAVVLSKEPKLRSLNELVIIALEEHLKRCSSDKEAKPNAKPSLGQ